MAGSEIMSEEGSFMQKGGMEVKWSETVSMGSGEPLMLPAGS